MAGGEMEKSSAGANHQLPEVDSLPDGFVDSSSSAETPLPFSPVSPSSPQTPNATTTTTTTTTTITTFEQQKRHSTQPSVDYKEDKLSDEPQQDLSSSADKTEKHRTFPVPLSDRQEDQCFSSSSSSSKVNVVPESSMMITTQSESQPEPTMDQHEHLCPISTGGCPELDVTNPLEKSTSECAEILKTKKLETSEVKRKNVKRSFKSEKEFLEFTLKYQQVIAERDSAAVVRDKLESLCRELQRQNKLLMDECKRVSTEGQNMRLDLSTRFHDAIKDVSQRLEGQKDECLTQLKENDMLRNKLKHLADQYATSEHQFTQKLKQKTLQLQLADLKIQQHEEKLTQEQAQVKLYAEQVSQLLATEHTLRLQLAADGEKFQQFQDALIKSNEVFETFKQEIEKMAKSIKELKKENAFLKGKCERSDVTLIELVEEREQWKKQLEKIKNQKEKLESLCRSLQAERRQTSADNRDSVPFQSKAISSEQVS